MDKSVFVQTFKELEAEVRKIEGQISDLRMAYFLENAPFRIGDQVQIVNGAYAGSFGVIENYRLLLFDWNIGSFTYQVNAVTKKGTAHPRRVLQYYSPPEDLMLVKKGYNWGSSRITSE